MLSARSSRWLVKPVRAPWPILVRPATVHRQQNAAIFDAALKLRLAASTLQSVLCFCGPPRPKARCSNPAAVLPDPYDRLRSSAPPQKPQIAMHYPSMLRDSSQPSSERESH